VASLYIAELSDPEVSLAGRIPVDAFHAPPVAEQKVAIGGTSTQSVAFNASTRVVRLHADAICSVAFGASPTATAANLRMAAGQTEYFGVVPGSMLAVITNT
jgi:hypothetical protein